MGEAGSGDPLALGPRHVLLRLPERDITGYLHAASVVLDSDAPDAPGGRILTAGFAGGAPPPGRPSRLSS